MVKIYFKYLITTGIFIAFYFLYRTDTGVKIQDRIREQSNGFWRASDQRSQTEQRKVIVIVSQVRSGSSFLGAALSAHPKIYYHFEPLFFHHASQDLYKKDLKKRLETGAAAVQDVRLFADCNYTQLEDCVIRANVQKSFLWKMNNKLDGHCFQDDPLNDLNTTENRAKYQKLQQLKINNFYNLNFTLKGEEKVNYTENKCGNVTFLTDHCRKYPVQLIKLVRLPFEFAHLFMEDPAYHVIYLARDPRGNYLSRKNVVWCYLQCLNMTNACNQMGANFEEYEKLRSKFEDRTTLVKYEDVARDPYTQLKNILSRVGLSWDIKVQEYLDSHTKADQKLANAGWETFNTFKNSKAKADLWKKELNKTEIASVESQCKKVLKYFK